MNKNLVVIEYKTIRVLTTQQIAEAYGTNTDAITKNFNRNDKKCCEVDDCTCVKYKNGKKYCMGCGNVVPTRKDK